MDLGAGQGRRRKKGRTHPPAHSLWEGEGGSPLSRSPVMLRLMALRKKPTSVAGVVIALGVILLAAVLRGPAQPGETERGAGGAGGAGAEVGTQRVSPPEAARAAAKASPAGGFGDEAALLKAFAARRSGVLIEVTARVKRLLPDDTDGSKHQRFILELSGGHTVMVAHNIDLAPRAPVRAGEAATVRGQYEWNEQGGVLHWTHHDPGKRRPGGWIEVGGKRYE